MLQACHEKPQLFLFIIARVSVATSTSFLYLVMQGTFWDTTWIIGNIDLIHQFYINNNISDPDYMMDSARVWLDYAATLNKDGRKSLARVLYKFKQASLEQNLLDM